MIAPGLVFVWSGEGPRHQAIAIGEAVVIGRDWLEPTTDDRISRDHVRVIARDDHFVVTDLDSRNGTSVAGHRIEHPVTCPPSTVVRAGRTVFVVVDDIRHFLDPQLTHRDGEIVCASMRPIWQRLDRAVEAEDNVLVLGPPGSAKRRIARAYARLRGRPAVMFDPLSCTHSLEELLRPDTATVVIDQIAKLAPVDLETVATWLETDVRFVTSATRPLDQLGIPPEVARRLAPRTITLPALRDRPDELAPLLLDAVRRVEPALRIHATVSEVCALAAWPGDEAELAATVAEAARTVARSTRRGERMRGEHLSELLDRPAMAVRFAQYFERIMGRPPPFAIPEEYVVTMHELDTETMIGSQHAAPMVMPIDLGTPHEPGWFQAGFWGHGVNSYAFYFSEVTDRHRVFFRLPYGGGVYSSDPEAERRVTLAMLDKYLAFRRLDVVRAVLLDSMGTAYYEIERVDGSVVKSDGALYSLANVDLVRLATG